MKGVNLRSSSNKAACKMIDGFYRILCRMKENFVGKIGKEYLVPSANNSIGGHPFLKIEGAGI